LTAFACARKIDFTMAKTKSTKRVRTLSPEDVQRELKKFERKYGITSDEFWHRYFRGEMPDEGPSTDLVLWIAYCRMARVDANSRA
jgi:hypothetical protein